MDITKDLLEPLGLVAVRANSEWIVIRRKGYFDTFLEGEPFTSVEVIWNRSQDTVLARVWGKTMHKTGNANLAKICKRVFSRRPCFGIWKQDLGSDFIERLKPCDFPVLRFKSLSCVDWVDSAETITDPATCLRCQEDATRDAAEDPAFLVEAELEPLATGGSQPIVENGERIKTEDVDVKSEADGDYEMQDEEEGSDNEHDSDEEDRDDDYDGDKLDESVDDQKDYIDDDDDGKHSIENFETYDLRIKSVFMKDNPNRKRPNWQTDKGENMYQIKNWMPFFFPNGKRPICPFCGAVKADQNIVRKHVKVC